MPSTDVPRRMGVLGGAFDPPHLGHVTLAQVAVRQLRLDALHLVPTGQAWHKTRALTAPEHRLAMVRLAFGAVAQAQVDAREICRAGPSYSVDTLTELRSERPQARWFLIVGADQLRAFTTWRRWRELLEIATLCVATRPLPERSENNFDADPEVLRRSLKLDMPALDISATAIRMAVSTHQDVSALVGAPVARYIAAHHLYQAA